MATIKEFSNALFEKFATIIPSDQTFTFIPLTATNDWIGHVVSRYPYYYQNFNLDGKMQPVLDLDFTYEIIDENNCGDANFYIGVLVCQPQSEFPFSAVVCFNDIHKVKNDLRTLIRSTKGSRYMFNVSVLVFGIAKGNHLLCNSTFNFFEGQVSSKFIRNIEAQGLNVYEKLKKKDKEISERQSEIKREIDQLKRKMQNHQKRREQTRSKMRDCKIEAQMHSVIRRAAEDIVTGGVSTSINNISTAVVDKDLVSKIGNVLENAIPTMASFQGAADGVRELTNNINKFFVDGGLESVGIDIALSAATVFAAPKPRIILIEIAKLVLKYTPLKDKAHSLIFDFIIPTLSSGLGMKGTSLDGLEAEAQGLMDEEISEDMWPGFMPVGASIACILGALIIGKVNPKKAGESALKYWGDNGKHLHGMKLGITTAMDFAYFVVGEIKRFILEYAVLPGELCDIKAFFTRNKIDVSAYIDDVNDLVNPVKRVQYNTAPETKARISRLLDTCTKMGHLIAVNKLKLTPAVSALVTRSNTLLHQYAAEFVKVDSSNVNRPTPYCFWLYGDPGVGKSTLVQQMAKDMFNPRYNDVVPHQPNNLVYVRSAQDPHWNNYNHQAVTIVDDIAQGRGWSTDLSDILQWMCMVGPIYWSVRMAAIGDKGTPFTSSLVICTTNVPYPTPTEVIKKEAVWRRRNALIHVTKTDDYKIREWHKLRFRLLDPTCGTTTKTLTVNGVPAENWTYVQLMRYLIPEFIAWYKTGLAMTNEIDFTDLGDIEAQMDSSNNLEEEISVEPSPDLDSAIELDKESRWERIVKWIGERRPEYSTIVKAIGIGIMALGAYKLAKGFMTSKDVNKWKKVATATEIAGSAAIIKRNLNPENVTIVVPEGKLYDNRILSAKPQTKLILGNKVRPEGCIDPQAEDLFREKIAYKNLLRLEFHRCTDQGVNTRRICAVGVGGHAILVPYHILADLNEYVDVDIHKFGKVWTMRRDLSNIKPISYKGITYDLCILEGPPEMEACPKIVKHFIDENQLDMVVNIPAMLVSYTGGSIMQNMNFKAISLREKIEYHTKNPDGTSLNFEMHKGFEYNCPTKIGDCGSLLFLLSTHVGGKIAGMHVAGVRDMNHGFAAPLSRQLVEHALDLNPEVVVSSVKLPSPLMVDFNANQLWVGDMPEGQSLSVIGKIAPKFCRPYPRKSEIIESPLFDLPWKHTKEPSVLRPSDPRQLPEYRNQSPLKNGILKYQNPIHNFPQEDVDRAVLVVTMQHLHIDPIGMERRLLTEKEVINGVPLANYTRLNPTSSPGLPWVDFRPAGTKGKRFLFCELEDGTMWYSDTEYKHKGRNVNFRPGAMLAKAYRDLIEQLENGDDVDFFCSYTNLKDELRTISKVEQGNTRLFECLSLHFNMAVRRYYGAYIAMLNQNCTKVTPAVGVDCLSPDWTKIYNHMIAIGRNTIAGDYKNWDGSLKAQILEASADAVNNWYNDGPINARIRRTLMRMMIKLYIMAGDVMLEKCVGMPSGAPITADINSIANHIQIITALIGLARENKVSLDLNNIDQLIRVKTYGDDNVIVVSDEIPFFNFSSLRDYFKEYGITYTTPDKKVGEGIKYWDFSEITFLKRKFIPHDRFPDRMLAPMDIATPDEMCHWIKDCEDPYEACRVNVENAYREYHQHGLRVFREKTVAITEAYKRRLKEDPSNAGYDLRELRLPLADFHHYETEWLSKFED